MNDFELFSIISNYIDLVITLLIFFISFITFLDNRYKKDDK